MAPDGAAAKGGNLYRFKEDVKGGVGTLNCPGASALIWGFLLVL
jgi:hypothetical protein